MSTTSTKARKAAAAGRGRRYETRNGEVNQKSASEARTRKISVSMPESLTAAVQERVERGGFSQYVTKAVERQLELDLLAELSETMEAEQGPVPETELAKARLAWPDVE